MKAVYRTEADERYNRMLADLCGGVDVVFLDYKSDDELIRRAGEFDIIVGARVPREFLEKARKLKYFIIPFTGVPPQDAEVLPNFPHLTVMNSHYNGIFAAEMAWALLLASARGLCPVHEKLVRGDWTPRYEHALGKAVADRELLVLGYGEIGRRVAQIGKAFGMRVSAVKSTPGDAPEIDFLGTRRDLPELLGRADFIVAALPGTDATRGFLGKEEFAKMKRGVHVVNVGRGYVIDEDAFYDALESGVVGGAGIDTWWNYPPDKESRACTPPSKHPLGKYDNVVFSPHRASHVADREEYRVKDVARLLKSIAAGSPENVVDLSKGY